MDHFRLTAAPLGLATALAGLLLACGVDDAVAPTGASMAAPSPSAAAANAQGHSENRSPQIKAVRLRPGSPRAGEPLRAVVDAGDPDGDPVRLIYRWTVNGQPAGNASAELPAGRLRKGDRVTLEVFTSDGRAQSPPERVTARVRNSPPRVRQVRLLPDGEIHARTLLRAVAEASDSDADDFELRFRWRVNGQRVAETGDRFSTDSLRRGDAVQVEVVAEDGEDTSEPVFSVARTLENAAPRITSQPEALAGGGFDYTLRVEDPDGDSLLRSALVRAPEGMTIDPQGRIRWEPRADQVGNHAVEVSVEDGHGGRAVQRFALIIGDAPSAPAAPQSP